MTTALSRFARSTPEQQGVDSEGIAQFLTAVHNRQLELHSLMMVRHNHVVAEGWWSPYGPDRLHQLFSLSKSFTSTAIGFAVQEGLLSVEDAVISFFPDDLPEEVTPHLAAMQIQHLLMMGTGHDSDTMIPITAEGAGDNWARIFLQCPVVHAPGTFFLYNTGATYMLSAILHKVTGISLTEFLQPRLFGPLGITEAVWETCPRGIQVGGFGLSLKTEDIARLGQLYLQRGHWQGKQLLSEDWIKAASSQQIANGNNPDSDWNQGYGYQFWMCRHGAYRGDGAFGQYCVVLPDKDAVIAITSGLGDMQAVLNLIWEHLLPAMHEDALAANEAAASSLVDRLAQLAYPPQSYGEEPPAARLLDGRTIHFADNGHPLKLKSLRLSFPSDEGIMAHFDSADGEYDLHFGKNAWQESPFPFYDQVQSAVSSAAWSIPDRLTVVLRMVNTPTTFHLELQLEGRQVRLSLKPNLFMGPEEWQPLEGTLEG